MKINWKDKLLVSIQFLLFISFLIDFNWSLGFSTFIQKIGLLSFTLGLIIITISFIQLNKNLTAFPTPKKNAVLLSNGLYKFVRHPIYTGVILTFLGYSFYQNSVYKLLITILLIILFHFKTNYEEQQLEKKFSNYKLYKSKTGKFLPKIF